MPRATDAPHVRWYYEAYAHVAFFPLVSLLLAQGPGACVRGAVVPMLRQRGLQEHMEVMGHGVFLPPSSEQKPDDSWASPLRNGILCGQWSNEELRSMSGNSMHLGAVGACMLFTLAYTEG